MKCLCDNWQRCANHCLFISFLILVAAVVDVIAMPLYLYNERVDCVIDTNM